MFLTGRNGFEGTCLGLWLEALGAKLFDLGFEAATACSLYEQAGQPNQATSGSPTHDPRDGRRRAASSRSGHSASLQSAFATRVPRLNAPVDRRLVQGVGAGRSARGVCLRQLENYLALSTDSQ